MAGGASGQPRGAIAIPVVSAAIALSFFHRGGLRRAVYSTETGMAWGGFMGDLPARHALRSLGVVSLIVAALASTGAAAYYGYFNRPSSNDRPAPKPLS